MVYMYIYIYICGIYVYIYIYVVYIYIYGSKPRETQTLKSCAMARIFLHIVNFIAGLINTYQ